MNTGSALLLVVLLLAASGFLLSEYIDLSHESSVLRDENVSLQQDNHNLRQNLAVANSNMSACYAERDQLQRQLEQVFQELDIERRALAEARLQLQALQPDPSPTEPEAAAYAPPQNSLLLPNWDTFRYHLTTMLPLLLVILVPAVTVTGLYRSRIWFGRPTPSRGRQPRGDTGEVWVRMTREQASEFARQQRTRQASESEA